MTIAFEAPGVVLHHGDCRDVLPTIPDESVHAIVTDPPYELGLMGKGWDATGIAHDVDMWRECLRVLKPGGFLLSFGGTRTWHRMAVAIEDAGFELRDSIAWLYGSGFPKSMDVARAIDTHLTFGGSSQRQTRQRDMGDEYRPHPLAGTAGFGDGNLRKGADGDSEGRKADLSHSESRGWQGWGTALKPAFEPIVVARKPIVGTVAKNVLEHGTGALNIDATRTATNDSLGGGAVSGAGLATKSEGWDRPWMKDETAVAAHADRVKANVEKAESLGRWPTNVILDESQALELDRQAPETGAQRPVRGVEDSAAVEGGGIYGRRERVQGPFHGDRGGASRFFPTFRYEAKAPQDERPSVDGVMHPTVKPLDLMRWLVRLVTPPDGTILEPFAGSGTTVEAALLENFNVIGIEKEATYLPLIEARITKPLQPAMFGDWDAA